MSDFSADSTVNFISDSEPRVTFYPWVGADFCNFPIRVLLVGQSHYADKETERNPNFTREVVADYGVTGRLPFFNRCAAMVTGYDASRLDLRRFWRRTAFANISNQVVDAPRHRPTDDALRSGAHALISLLPALKPDCIITLGNDVWAYLEGSGMKPDEGNAGKRFRGLLANTPVFFSYHPSSSGRYFYWRTASQYFGEFLRDPKYAFSSEDIIQLTDCLAPPPESELLNPVKES